MSRNGNSNWAVPPEPWEIPTEAGPPVPKPQVPRANPVREGRQKKKVCKKKGYCVGGSMSAWPSHYGDEQNRAAPHAQKLIWTQRNDKAMTTIMDREGDQGVGEHHSRVTGTVHHIIMAELTVTWLIALHAPAASRHAYKREVAA